MWIQRESLKMQIIITRRLALALTILIVVSVGLGFFLGRVIDPPQQVTGQTATDITKYCTAIYTGGIPSPFNQWFPQAYRNGSYTLYSCKTGTT
jgi:hypothetical protein